jgi:hypothetical protein
MEARWSSETLVPYSVTAQKTSTWIFTAMKSNLAISLTVSYQNLILPLYYPQFFSSISATVIFSSCCFVWV